MSDNPEAAQPAPEATPTPTPEAPVEAAPAVATTPKKKSKAPAIIIGSIVAAGCIAGVSFALVNTVFKSSDAVTEAISRLFSGNAPKNMEISGEVNLTGDGVHSKSGKLTIDTKMSSDNHASDTSLSLDATLGDGSNINLGLGTKVLASGDTYIKVSGVDSTTIDKIMRNSTITYGTEPTNCINDTTGLTNCGDDVDYGDAFGSAIFSGIFEALSMLNNIWIKIPGELISQYSGSTSGITLDQSSQCLLNAVNNMSDYGKTVSDLYKDHKFITSSTDNISVAKKNNDIYKLGIDNDKLAEFINAASNTQFASDIKACAGDSIKVAGDITSAQIAEVTKELPTTYVEIDGSYNITRLYVEGRPSNVNANVTADLSISYPSFVEVSAPSDAQDITTLITSLFMGGSSYMGGSDYIDFGDYDDYDFDFDSDDFDYDSLLQMLQ